MENTFENMYPTDFMNGLLTKRELEVLHLLTKGSLNKEIAIQLNISLSTVKRHTVNIFSKIKVRNRAEAIMAYHAHIKMYSLTIYTDENAHSLFE